MRQQVLGLLLGCGLLVSLAQAVQLNVRLDPVYIISLSFFSFAALLVAIAAFGLPIHQQGVMLTLFALSGNSLLALSIDKSGRNLYVNLRQTGEENMDLNEELSNFLHGRRM